MSRRPRRLLWKRSRLRSRLGASLAGPYMGRQYSLCSQLPYLSFGRQVAQRAVEQGRGEQTMKVVDLPQKDEGLYCQCLEEWSDEMREAGSLKSEWFRRMKSRGLRVKVALDDNGVIGGMIHYAPIESVAVQGSDLYYVYCIWVHGYTRGPGQLPEQGNGEGTPESCRR